MLGLDSCRRCWGGRWWGLGEVVVEGIDAEDCHSQLLVMETAWWYVPNGVNDASGDGRHGRL